MHKHHITRIAEGEKNKLPKKTFEEMVAENFPNIGKETINQVKEAKRVSHLCCESETILYA